MAVKGDVGKIMFHNAAGTEAEYSATLGEIEEIAISFITTGAITSAI